MEQESTHASRLGRREFLSVVTLAGGGFALGVSAFGSTEAQAAAVAGGQLGADFAPNAWIRIHADGRLIFVLDKAEMGQGVYGSLAVLVAEELECEPEQLAIEFAGADRAYANPALGIQLTGGSSSVASGYLPLREAGARAREMLRSAAAKRWKVPAKECVCAGARISHAASKNSASFGELAAAAAKETVPKPVLKEPSAFRLIGKPQARPDAKAKADGTAGFGIDVQMPGMLCAAVARAPALGARVKTLKDTAARSSLGVKAVLQIPSGVAVVAEKYWQAKKALAKLEIEWDLNAGGLAAFSTDALLIEQRALLAKKGSKARNDGDTDDGFAAASKVVEAEYRVPYLAHQTLEPQNCTARVTKEECDIWGPTQGPAVAQTAAVRVLGLPRERIRVHQTFLGGGFGRRIGQDFVAEAVEIARRMPGVPVKVIWTREDDTKHDLYRPCSLSKLRAGMDDKGNITAWWHRLVTGSILAHVTPDLVETIMPDWMPNGVGRFAGRTASRLLRGTAPDSSSTEGADRFAYGIKNARVEHVFHDPGVPLGFWRSVGHSGNQFLVESFIDELAHAAGKDPFAFRRDLLPAASKNRKVLELAAAKAGWGLPREKGRFLGIAQGESFGTAVAEVAEVSVEGTRIRVHKVVVAVDCGLAVNPAGVEAQMVGSVLFGLSAALFGRITFKDGAVEQSNFHDAPILRMNEAPLVEVHLVPSAAAPTGVGEPGLPPLAPAVANAVFAATGKRLRALPLELA